jgi:hypothetical protein
MTHSILAKPQFSEFKFICGSLYAVIFRHEARTLSIFGSHSRVHYNLVSDGIPDRHLIDEDTPYHVQNLIIEAIAGHAAALAELADLAGEAFKRFEP